MFDANAAGVDVGEYFFAEVHSANRKLKELGVKDGSIILCQHQRKSDGRFGRGDHTKVWVSNESVGQDYFGSVLSGGSSFLVYSGLPNGEGFICKDWMAKALEFLGGAWEESIQMK